MTGKHAPSSQPTSIVPFAFKNHPIRTVIDGDGAPWFVAKDTAAALGLKWHGKILSCVPDQWLSMRKVLTDSRGARDTTIISEPAVYKLAFRSNKPEADEFTNWVASVVLPSIRKTGNFEAKAEPLALSPDQQQHLRNLVAARAKALPHGSGFPQIWERVKNHFGVARYQDIPSVQFGEVVEYLLKMDIKVEQKALPAPESSTLQDYARIFGGLPPNTGYWGNLQRRLLKASMEYDNELRDISKQAKVPFVQKRKGDVATFFDSAMDPLDTLFRASEANANFSFNCAHGALSGYKAMFELLTKG